MKLIITESQLIELTELYQLTEDNDYFDYSNVTDAQKRAFGRNQAGYAPKKVKTPKPPVKSVELWMPQHVDLLNSKNSDIIKNGKWIMILPFAQWAFAERWVKQRYPRLTKEYYRIIPKYE